jgi:hypothetical protein
MFGVEEKVIALLYQLTLEDAEQQAIRGFPMLRMIRNNSVANFLRAAEDLTLEQKIRLSVALVKGQHLELFKGLALYDTVSLQFVSSERMLYNTYQKMNVQSLGSNSFSQKSTMEKPVRIHRKRLAHIASAALSSVIKSEFSREDAFYWRAVNHFDPWVVETWMDITQQGFEVEQHICHITDYPVIPTQDLQRQRIRHCLTYNYPRRLGVSSLSWQLNSDEEIEESAALAAEVCLHSMNLISSALEYAGG